jgi:citrate lyase beta subunit
MLASISPTSPRRSWLFVPGDSQRKVEKALTLAVDTLILDLEDGVAVSQKVAARQSVAASITSLHGGARECLVRINPLCSPWGEEDLTETLAGHPHGYVLPKVETAAQLQTVDARLTRAELHQGWRLGSLTLVAMVETAAAVMNLRDIAGATPRLSALIFGAEDFAADLGAVRSKAGWELFYARSAVVTAAAAYGLQAIDMVYVDLHDLDGLAAECQQGRQLGFVGKTAIHPNQLNVINQTFVPSEAEVMHAQRVVQGYAESQAAGLGAFALDGKMVDQPIVRAAERILARAHAAGRVM